jgi:type VI secretion system secreted protein Hcp
MLLQVQGLDTGGAGADPQFPGSIALQSFSWGVTNTVSIGSGGGGAGTGKAVLQNLVVTKRLDGVTPALFVAAAEGAHFARAVLTVKSTGGAGPALTQYTFEQVFVVGLVDTGSQGEPPLEQVTLLYGSAAITQTA